jgi:hypothetical protein
VIIFVTLHDGTRDAFVGDLVWQLEGITEREERPWASEHSDSDAAGTRANLLPMIAIQKRPPDLNVVPAHDMRAFARMPTLPYDPASRQPAWQTSSHWTPRAERLSREYPP